MSEVVSWADAAWIHTKPEVTDYRTTAWCNSPKWIILKWIIKQIVHEHVDKKTVTRPGSIMISEAEAVERVR